MIIILLLTCFILLLVHYYAVYLSRKGRLINKIPGFIDIPITGNLLTIGWCSKEMIWLIIYVLMQVYYPIFKFWFFTIPNVIVCTPDNMEIILNSTKLNVKGITYKGLHNWLHEGLLLSTGAKWQKRRKILTPAFHFSVLKKYVDILIEEGNRASNSFDRSKETVIENLMLFTSHHTLNAICETAMGISLHNMGSFQEKYRKAIYDMGNIVIDRFFNSWLYNDTIFKLSSTGRMETKCFNVLHKFTEKIIKERKKYHEQTGGQYLNDFENNTIEDTEVLEIKKKRMAMLDILIAESRKSGLSDLDIREEVDTFMFEGHDTVATAITFTLLLLAEHKDIQDRVRKEVKEEMEKTDGNLTMNTLQNLSYLERCIKEALRLYPSVPIISRTCTEDVKLSSHLLPKGTSVHLFIYQLHRDSKIWPNPKKFDPDRFLLENIQKRHPYSYLPFSAGQRNCIGQKFAMLELKALIAPLINNYYFEPVDYLKNVRFKLDFVLRASRPLRIKVIPIESEGSSNENS